MEITNLNANKTAKKIAIIGAGASGVHMATVLKKKGYGNITIFEKSDRIGGKTRSIVRNNVNHEMGTTGFSVTDASGLKSFIEALFPDIDASCYVADIMALRKHSFIVSKTKPTAFKTAQKYDIEQILPKYEMLYDQLVN